MPGAGVGSRWRPEKVVTRKGGAWNVPDFYREGEQCWAQWRKQLCALGTEDLWECAAMPRSSCRWSGAGGRGLQRAVCWFTLPSPECVLLRPSTKGPMWQSFYWYHPCAPSRLQVGPGIDTLSSQPQQPPMNSWAA